MEQRYLKMKQWVLEIGSVLLKENSNAYEIREKSDFRDIVSQYDTMVETYLSDRICREFPMDRIVGEELPHESICNQEFCWYIDPIDGTTNFVNERKDYAISVGCYCQNQPCFGLVYDVAGALMYEAKNGGGAYCNGQEIKVNKLHTQLSEMLLLNPMIVPTFLEEHERQKKYCTIAQKVRAVRSVGSVALELCELAAGRADLFFTLISNSWDHNAARIILKEAGGFLCLPDGGEVPITGKYEIIAGASERVRNLLLQEGE